MPLVEALAFSPERRRAHPAEVALIERRLVQVLRRVGHAIAAAADFDRSGMTFFFGVTWSANVPLVFQGRQEIIGATIGVHHNPQ